MVIYSSQRVSHNQSKVVLNQLTGCPVHLINHESRYIQINWDKISITCFDMFFVDFINIRSASHGHLVSMSVGWKNLSVSQSTRKSVSVKSSLAAQVHKLINQSVSQLWYCLRGWQKPLTNPTQRREGISWMWLVMWWKTEMIRQIIELADCSSGWMVRV